MAIREIQPDAPTAWGPLALRALGFAHCQRAHCEGRSTVGLISKNLSAVNFTGSSKSKTNSTCQSLLLLSETSAHEVGISAIVDGIRLRYRYMLLNTDEVQIIVLGGIDG